MVWKITIMRTRIQIAQRHIDRQPAQHPLAAAIFDQVYGAVAVQVSGDHVDIEFEYDHPRRFFVRRRDSDWLEQWAAGDQVKPTTIYLR
jgi:hypothetical protein